MGDFRELKAWTASRELAVITYRLTERFPRSERYGLAAQMRRAAVSVMSNIAEGAGRGTDRQFAAMLGVARGSLCELESQCYLAADLGYGSAELSTELLDASTRTGRLLHGLAKSLVQESH
jgi:four helix bundle protein